MAEGRKRALKRATKSEILNSEVRERLETLSENVDILVKQIKNGITSHHSCSLSLQDFHKRFRINVQTISDLSTKLSLLFLRPPCPSLNDTGVLSSKLETATLNLTSTYCQHNPEWGKYLLMDLKNFMIDVLEGVANLGRILMTDGCKSDSRMRLQGTGSVWEHCNRIDKLPFDNKSAVVKVCISQLQLLRDASGEINELVERNGARDIDDFDFVLKDMLSFQPIEEPSTSTIGQHTGGTNIKDDDGKTIRSLKCELTEKDFKGVPDEWSDEDKVLVTTCIDLIKLTVVLADRSCRILLNYGELLEVLDIHQLDAATDMILQLSPHVDELASLLEAPIDCKLLLSESKALHSVLCQYIDFLSGCHFYDSVKDHWPLFECKANLDELKIPLDTHQNI